MKTPKYKVTSVSIDMDIHRTAIDTVVRDEYRGSVSAYTEALIKADLKARGITVVKLEENATK